MSLDPLTLVAQLINFALLVVLLWRFLFRPVAATLHDREERIRREMEGAAQAREEAERQEAAARAEREDRVHEHDRQLREIQEEIERKRGEWLQSARAEAEQEHLKHVNRLREEREEARVYLRRAGARVVAAAVEKGLQELAGRSLEQAAVERFEERLKELPGPQRSALRAGKAPWTLATAYPLDDAPRRRLVEMIARELDVRPDIRVVLEPELLAGVELRAGALSLGWSMRHLADDLAQQLERPQSGAAGAPDFALADDDGLEEVG